MGVGCSDMKLGGKGMTIIIAKSKGKRFLVLYNQDGFELGFPDGSITTKKLV